MVCICQLVGNRLLLSITLIAAFLKEAGYLKVVNANHLHDLGKFCFAFSIFWTYIWFGQFLLIYYANIPEETIYFIERTQDMLLTAGSSICVHYREFCAPIPDVDDTRCKTSDLDAESGLPYHHHWSLV